MICVSNLMAICEKVSISLWILFCGILKYVKCLMVGGCVYGTPYSHHHDEGGGGIF